MKKILLGKKCNPSKILNKTVINATKIVSSFGGGMGGATITYYAIEVYKLPEEIIIKDIRGRNITLNNRFIVSQEVVTIVKVTTDTTEHTNSFPHHRCNQSIYKQYNVVYSNETWDLVDDVVQNNDRRVYSEVDTL